MKPDMNAQFKQEVAQNIADLGKDNGLKDASNQWIIDTAKYNYSYNFSCLGRPIIQVPQDMVAMQELIWQIKPDLIIETGIAHGGSLILSASMLATLDYVNAVEKGTTLDPKATKRKVLGIDIDIRAHNLEAIKSHPMSHHIDMIEGSSVAQETIQRVKDYAKGFNTVLVCLDSNHTHQHVLDELNAYSELVSPGSYCVVFDTIVDDMPDDQFPNRPWGPGDNPKTAVHEFLKSHTDFQIDHSIEDKLLITVAPSGYLKRISK